MMYILLYDILKVFNYLKPIFLYITVHIQA